VKKADKFDRQKIQIARSFCFRNLIDQKLYDH
jgi:hypothetical protein